MHSWSIEIPYQNCIILYKTTKNCPVKKISFGRVKLARSITHFCALPPYCIAILVVLEITLAKPEIFSLYIFSGIKIVGGLGEAEEKDYGIFIKSVLPGGLAQIDGMLSKSMFLCRFPTAQFFRVV